MLDKRKFYINGQWVEPIKKNDLEVVNPCNEDPFAVISLGSKEDTDLAVKSAKIAFETWKETGKEERLNLLNKLLSVYKKDLVKWLRLFLWRWAHLWIGQQTFKQLLVGII
jgi:aldehyde dehydrogenase (NAD+)